MADLHDGIDIKEILERNKEWAKEKVESDDGFFARTSEKQTPHIFWIGCSDSRVPANVVTTLDFGELFVVRNVANIASGNDLGFLATLQYAVNALKVDHIVVCGHTGCGGVKASMSDHTDTSVKPGVGLVSHWLAPVRQLYKSNAHLFQDIADPEVAANLLVKLNVRAQVDSVCSNPVVQLAWERGQPLEVHGWVYDLRDGILRDLDCTHSGP
ncbi:MAG: carbonic anhydrase [Rhodospirillaceae bacterium]